jgi:hypothetical protein
MRRNRTLGMLAVVAVSALLLLPNSAAAQFGKNQTYLGAHVGLSGVGSAASYGVNGEVAYNEHIGIGAWLDTWSYGYSYTTYSWNVRYIALAGTGAYHFPVKSEPKLDPFVGAAVGYYVVHASESSAFGNFSYNGNGNRLFVGGFGGARWAFNPNLSGVARVGFGASYLTIGLDWKMK